MQKPKPSLESLKAKLDEQSSFPSLYMFKFIVPKEEIDEVKKLFPRHDVSIKPSSKGAYISLTAKIMAKSSDEIIAVYREAWKIEGIISL
jgi:uncharacterized protein